MDLGELKPGYEAVFTVMDYYDGPRRGIANYQGKPHFYESIFDEAKDDYSDLFRLTPLETKTFELAMEAWAIWKRWEMAYHTGKTTLATHPSLPEDAQRSRELEGLLEKVLVTDSRKSLTLVGRFEACGSDALPKGVLRPLQVKWTEPVNFAA